MLRQLVWFLIPRLRAVPASPAVYAAGAASVPIRALVLLAGVLMLSTGLLLSISVLVLLAGVLMLPTGLMALAYIPVSALICLVLNGLSTLPSHFGLATGPSSLRVALAHVAREQSPEQRLVVLVSGAVRVLVAPLLLCGPASRPL